MGVPFPLDRRSQQPRCTGKNRRSCRCCRTLRRIDSSYESTDKIRRPCSYRCPPVRKLKLELHRTITGRRAQRVEVALLPGDVAAFHGVHVAAYIGNDTWMDSDCRHGGVGIMRRNRKPGGWFYGEVKVLRWKHTRS
jgi:hypothetical protein